MELDSGLATAYAAILAMAVTPIYIGSQLSKNQKGVESMSTEDAWKFPFVGSGVLFGLYILFKVFSKDYINMLLTGYFLLFGILAVGGTIKPLFLPLFSKPLTQVKKTIKVPFKSDPFELEFDAADVVSMIVATAIGVWYALTKHWISNNILGLSFSIQGIAFLSLGSYKVGCILLGGLFFYDIFWVFGTDVMVTVAKSFDAPIKLLFPKDLFAAELQYSMLGLGDIVIPGIFIALLLRYDIKRSQGKSLSYLYFHVCYLAYIAGLVTTVVVMHVFKHAQPALLYLVPACLGSSFLLALARGELTQLFAYADESAKKPETTADQKKDK